MLMKTTDNSHEMMELLKSELSLLDTDDYFGIIAKEAEKCKANYQNNLKKDLDEVQLNETDYAILQLLTSNISDSYFEEFGFERLTLTLNTLEDMENKYSEEFKKLLKKLSQYEPTSIILSPNERRKSCHGSWYSSLANVNAPVEDLLQEFKYGSSGAKKHAEEEMQIRFHDLSFDEQIKILQAFLDDTPKNREWCYAYILRSWWNDIFIPDIENAWIKYGDPNCLRVIARRFPTHYLLAYVEQLERDNYLALCFRLALDKKLDFVVDKKRLSRKQYGRLIYSGHILLPEKESDNLLFGHIWQYLKTNYTLMNYCTNDIREYSIGYFCYEDFYAQYDYFHSLLFNYKPSLLFLPNTMFYIRALIKSGNLKTVLKFMLWEKRMQLSIPQFLSDEYKAAFNLKHPIATFKTYQDWSWKLLLRLAIDTCPVDKDSIPDEFGIIDESPVTHQDYDECY